MTQLDIMINMAEQLGNTSSKMKTLIDAMDSEVNAIRMTYLRKIMPISQEYGDRKQKLEAQIKEHPELFKKPRTVEINGVKFGMKKSSNGLFIEDTDKTLLKIRNLFPEKRKQLIKVTESVITSALRDLTSAELEALGVDIIPGNKNSVVVQVKTVDKAHAIVRKMIDTMSVNTGKDKMKLAS